MTYNNGITKSFTVTIATILILLLNAGCGARRSEQFRIEGDTYLRLQKYDEAITSYKKAEEANPKNPMAKVGLGRCYTAQKQTEQALPAIAGDGSEGWVVKIVQNKDVVVGYINATQDGVLYP